MEPTTSDTPSRGADDSGTETIIGRGSGMKDRGKWANKMEFRFALAGAIFGLSYTPYVFYANGGGLRMTSMMTFLSAVVFLIPYLVCLIFFGMPMFFLETALGQYTGEGPFTAWRKICPMFQGIGIACQVIVMYQSVRCAVFMAWALFYLYNSFKNPLPWSHCNNIWNTEHCQSDANWSYAYNSNAGDESNFTWPSFKTRFPSDEFWRSHVAGGGGHGLQFTGALGGLRWGLAFCLLLAWVACYFCIWKGVKYTGKVLYVTVAFPLFLLFILFIRGATLPGAWNGVMYYVYPDFSQIAYGHVWLFAAFEVLYSCALGQGVLTTIGSYNRYKHDCYNDCLLLCTLGSGSRVFSGLVLFLLVGFGAHSNGMSVSNFISNDLLYVSMLEALSLLPAPQFWCLLYFLVMLLFTLNFQFLIMESLVTTIMDIFPETLRRPGRREVLVLLVVLVCFLLGLPLVTEEGFNIYNMIGIYGLSETSLMFIVCVETIVIGWIYGANRFYDNIEDMIGYQPYPVLKYCWMFAIPLVSIVYIIYALVTAWIRPWGSHIGLPLTLAPILSIPIFVLFSVSKHEDLVTKPASDLKQASPSKPRLSLCKHVILAGHKSDSKRVDEENPAADGTTGV